MTPRARTYLWVTLSAALLGVLVWWCVPKRYAARVKLRDEYKETDLALGLNTLSVMARDLLNPASKGMNDMAVYCQTLKTRDFARQVGLDPDQIEYNYSNRQETLAIQVTDRNPVAAAKKLEQVVTHLQQEVTHSRQADARAQLASLQRDLHQAGQSCREARARYAAYCDSHLNVSREAELQEMARLRDEKELAVRHYTDLSEQYARQQALAGRNYNSFAVIQPVSVPQTDTSHWWVYVLVSVLLALAGTKAFYLFCERRREGARVEWGGVFSPWWITLLVWGGMGLMLLLFGDTLDPLTEQFYWSIALWLPILVLTSFVTYNLLRHDSRPLPTQGIEINRVLFYFFFALAVVLTPLYVYRVWQIVSAFGSKDMLKDVRNLAVYGTGQGFLNYAMVLSQSVMLVSLWRYPRMPLWQVLLAMICCLLNALAIMEKGTIFLVVLCSLYVLFERRVIRLRSILLLGGLAFVGFYGFNLMREGADSDYAKNESVLDFLGMYVLSPPVAFCRVRPEITSQFGTNTLETIYLFLNRFGLDVEVHQKLQEFVFVPVSTNVYTVMQPFFRDFGYWGVAFFAWVYGVASGVLYRLSRNGHVLAVVLYTYWVYVLVLQFYQENVFLSMVAIIQLVFFISLCVVRRVRLSL